MGYFDAIILGIVQGITEFLPISSSGHLIIVRDILNKVSANDLAVDAVLQLATAFAVLVYFAKAFFQMASSLLTPYKNVELYKENRTLALVIVLGTIPAVIFGLILEDAMETIFRNSTLVAITLLLGAALMVLAERMYIGTQNLTVKKGIVLGLFQALALVPGVSRSGATISGGMILGLSREMATRASFMLAVPILLGSGMKKGFELLGSGSGVEIQPLFIAFIVSFGVGMFAIRFLLKYLRSNNLYPFIYYRIFLAACIFIFF